MPVHVTLTVELDLTGQFQEGDVVAKRAAVVHLVNDGRGDVDVERRGAVQVRREVLLANSHRFAKKKSFIQVLLDPLILGRVLSSTEKNVHTQFYQPYKVCFSSLKIDPGTVYNFKNLMHQS